MKVIPSKSFVWLCDLLDSEGVPYVPQPEADAVHIAVRRHPLEEGVLTIRTQLVDAVLQFYIALPFRISEEYVAALESSILRINHILAIPGFGLDHGNMVAYVRTTAPMPPGLLVPAEIIRAWFSVTVRLAADFVEPLRRVAESGASPETVLHDAVVEAAIQANIATETLTAP